MGKNQRRQERVFSDFKVWIVRLIDLSTIGV